jgi:hypothetical protein
MGRAVGVAVAVIGLLAALPTLAFIVWAQGKVVVGLSREAIAFLVASALVAIFCGLASFWLLRSSGG